MTNMCTCVILLPLRLVANMFINNILIIAKMRLNLTNLKIEMYHAEGPMLKAPVAPVPLMVSCSKSRTTVGACTPKQMSQMQMTVPKACSPNSPYAQRIGTEKLRRQRSSEKWKTLIDYFRIFQTRNFQ